MISIFPSDHCPGIDGVAAAARRLGKTARVHVKVDSGFGRNGVHARHVRRGARQAGAARQGGCAAYRRPVEPFGGGGRSGRS